MEELDSLQMELEMLLNSVVLRSLELQKEVAGMTEKVFSLKILQDKICITIAIHWL